MIDVEIEDITKHSESLEDVYLKQIDSNNGGEE